jgi:hypothetical protein
VLPFQIEGGEVAEVDEVVVNALFEDGDEGALCRVCGEGFEKFWDGEEEEWMIRNAVKSTNVSRCNPL